VNRVLDAPMTADSIPEGRSGERNARRRYLHLTDLATASRRTVAFIPAVATFGLAGGLCVLAAALAGCARAGCALTLLRFHRPWKLQADEPHVPVPACHHYITSLRAASLPAVKRKSYRRALPHPAFTPTPSRGAGAARGSARRRSGGSGGPLRSPCTG